MFDLARGDARAAALLDSLAIAADGDIFSNQRAQPAIVAAGLAMWMALREHCPAPALVAGYSIGELTAYGVAGALDIPQAVALARCRAELMDACVREPQAMVAITGLSARTLAPMLAPHGFHVAIETSEDSVIAGGPADAAHALMQSVAAAGARAQQLPVAVASHTPAMADAVAPFANALRAASWRPSAAPVLGGIDAAPVRVTPVAVATTVAEAAAGAAPVNVAPVTVVTTVAAAAAGAAPPDPAHGADGGAGRAAAGIASAGSSAGQAGGGMAPAGGETPGAGDAVAHLSRQLAEPVRWMDCMDAMAEQGITAALELGPGAALSKMLRTRHPHIECRSVADFRTLDGIKRWLEKIA